MGVGGVAGILSRSQLGEAAADLPPPPSLKGRGWIAAEAAMTGWRECGRGAHQGRPYGLAWTYPSQEGDGGEGL